MNYEEHPFLRSLNAIATSNVDPLPRSMKYLISATTLLDKLFQMLHHLLPTILADANRDGHSLESLSIFTFLSFSLNFNPFIIIGNTHSFSHKFAPILCTPAITAASLSQKGFTRKCYYFIRILFLLATASATITADRKLYFQTQLYPRNASALLARL